MDLNLTIDVGNSSTKVVIYSADGTSEVAATTLRGPGIVNRLGNFIGGRPIGAAIACSVAKSVEPLLNAVDAPVKMELTHSTPVPLANGYATPATLGVDRMAAAVGAAALEPSADLLVCDLGTACTYDVVSGSPACFLGGNIAPGVGMRLRALHHYTERLPLVNAHVDTPVSMFGSDTTDALICGALRGVVAEVLYYRSLGVDSPRRVILTGGWAPELSRLLPESVHPTVTVHPHLVNQGLISILLYNRQ